MRDIGIAVLVAVVVLAVALHTKKEDTRLLVLRHYAGVHAGVDVVGALLGESAAVADTERVAVGLFGDDIHDARDGIGTIQGATSAADDLDTVHHTRRQLLQSIDRSQGREDRTRVHEDLGVLAL